MITDRLPIRAPASALAIHLLVSALLSLAVATPSATLGAQATTSSTAGAQWKLSPEPVLTIAEDGTPPTEFLRIGGVVRTSSGNIVVANTSSNELRIFGPTGKFIRTYGRQGSGPGETERMQWIGRAGDTLHVFDFKNRRISMFHASSGYLKSRAVPPTLREQSPSPRARYSNGDYLIEPLGSTALAHRDGLYTDSLQAGVLNSARDTITFFGTFPYLSYLSFNPTNAERAQSVGIYQFGGVAAWEVWGNLTWIAHSSSHDLVLYDKTGKKVNTIKLPWAAREFDKVAFEKFAKRELASVPAAQRNGFPGALFSAKYLPRYEPTFKQFKVAADGLLWIERYHIDPATPGECVVMSRTGTIVARVTLPGNFTPKEIGNEYVLGIHKDADGLESVAMYRIWK